MSETHARSQESAKTQEHAPFSYSLTRWTQADYERHLEEMKDIPCIDHPEVMREVRRVRDDIDLYYKSQNLDLWQTSEKIFSPKDIIARYDGRPWNYGFHEQRRVEYRAGTNPFSTKLMEEEMESVIIGIAKKMVHSISRMVREANDELHDAPLSDREAIQQKLVGDAERVFASIFPKADSSEAVMVDEFAGPRGSVYMTTLNGNHRMAAAQLINLKHVRGRARQIQDPELAKRYWYDLLAGLQPHMRTEVLDVYYRLHPFSSAQEAEDEQRELRAALARRPSMMEAVKKLHDEQRHRTEGAERVADLSRDQVLARYARTEDLYQQLKSPEFDQRVHRIGFAYMDAIKDEVSLLRGLDRVDEKGMLYAGNKKIEHVLGLSVDAHPRQTEKEIIALAVEEWEREQGQPQVVDHREAA